MKFVRARHPQVDAEALLPVSALALHARAGWEPVEVAEVVDTDRTVPQVLAEVGDDPVKAAAALEVEQASDSPRSTLVERLTRIADQ